MRESLTRKLTRSRLKWAGHVERMEVGEEGRRRRGRPRLRWEDCVKRDLAGVEGECRMKAKDGEWRKLVETAVKRD